MRVPPFELRPTSGRGESAIGIAHGGSRLSLSTSIVDYGGTHLLPLENAEAARLAIELLRRLPNPPPLMGRVLLDLELLARSYGDTT